MRLYGQPNSPEAYALRDFLNRSVVEFDWVELTCDADCDNELGLPSLENVRLPVVELPSGERMFAPTVREVAERLGWVTQPRFKEYDLSIYGAGPAGLSAAVYAASEGLHCAGRAASHRRSSRDEFANRKLYGLSARNPRRGIGGTRTTTGGKIRHRDSANARRRQV